MGQYELADSDALNFDYERNYYLSVIANELAEQNRLKRVELSIIGRLKDVTESDLRDQA